LAEHLGLTADAVAEGIERAGSLRSFIDSRQLADHTLSRIEIPPPEETATSEAARLLADPEEPIAFGSTVEELVPPADATNGLRPVPFPTIPVAVLVIALLSLSSAVIWRPEFRRIQDLLAWAPGQASIAWGTAAVIAIATLIFVPLELMAIAAGVMLNGPRGAAASLLGALAGAGLGYVLGRQIGPARLQQWMSRRSYRSARQLGARGVMGVVVLRLASVATSGSIHLLCGAGRIRFSTFMAGTLLAFVPAIAALAGLGAQLRHTLLTPTTSNVVLTIVAAIALTAAAAILRTLLLIRQFAPSVSRQRARAEFG
jgi:uncharacterized membrane protein YdjX (TVP38/TMEM64 family)